MHEGSEDRWPTPLDSGVTVVEGAAAHANESWLSSARAAGCAAAPDRHPLKGSRPQGRRSAGRDTACSATREISVVVPAHGNLPALRRCLGALESQTMAPERFEVLTVANGLDARGREEFDDVLSCWGDAFGSRLKVLEIAEASIPRARNAGVREATGRLVLQINQDTVLSDTALARHYEEHRFCGFDVRCVVVGGRRFPEDYRSNLMNYLYEEAGVYTPLHVAKPPFYGDASWFVTCNLSSQREAYEEFGYFDATLDWCSDTELGRRWAEAGSVNRVVTGIAGYHLHRLTFESYRRNILKRIPFRLRARTGRWPEELDEEARDHIRQSMEQMRLDELNIPRFEEEMRRLEEEFRGSDSLAGITFMGNRLATVEEAVRCFTDLLERYSARLLFEGILSAAEEEGPRNAPGPGARETEAAGRPQSFGVVRNTPPDRPRVTVLTPTYNRPEFLPDAIRSVVNQEFSDWEMLVINDGGLDVGEIVGSFGDERLRYLDRPENRGKAACLNLGLQEARGNFIAYLDDDDVWYPGHLAALVRALEENPGVGVAYSDLYKSIVLRDEEGRRFPLEKRVDVCRDFNRMLMFHFNHTLHVSLMHRKEPALRAGGYDEDVRVLIDWNLTRKLSFYTDFHHVEAPTGEYCVPLNNSDRISDVQREDEEEYLRNLRRIRADLPPQPWPKVRKVAVVYPVRRWNERTEATLRYFADSLDYPCRIVLVAENPRDVERKTRRVLGVPEGLPNMQVVGVPTGAGLDAAYRAGARAVEADLYYLPSPRLSPAVRERLIGGVCYMDETGCSGVRWPGEEGRPPYDVMLTADLYRSSSVPGEGEWPGVEVPPADWTPAALETDYLLGFAEQCEAEGDYETARHFLSQAVAVEQGGTGGAYLVQHMARVSFALGDYEPAERLCTELIHAGYGADNWVRLGRIRQARGEFRGAADAYRRGLETIGLAGEKLDSGLFPLTGEAEFDVFRAMAGLGECLVELDHAAEAARTLRKAARLRADSPRPYVAFGRLFLAAGDLAQAEEAFQLAEDLTDGVGCAGAAAGLAEVRASRGEFEAAYRKWLEALKVEPENEDYLEGAAEAGRRAAGAEELVQLYRRFLAHRPGYVPALTGLAGCCLELGHRDEAEELAERAALLQPGHPAARALLERVKSNGKADAAG